MIPLLCADVSIGKILETRNETLQPLNILLALFPKKKGSIQKPLLFDCIVYMKQTIIIYFLNKNVIIYLSNHAIKIKENQTLTKLDVCHISRRFVKNIT